jgi:hypothetical protein
MRPNGHAGRQLLELFGSGGFKDVKVEVMPFVHRDFSESPFGDWLINEAVKAKIAAEQETGVWRRELEEKTSGQTFLSHVNMVLVAGKKKQV